MKNIFIKINLTICLLVILATLMPINLAQAANTYGGEFAVQACPCLPETSTGTRYVRMQVYIPKITQICQYTEQTMIKGTLQDVQKNCYYVESDLPALIQRLYKFIIGVIAVLAFIMITVGGFKWIMAAGNAATIQDAKTTITSAVSGLVLALLSYLILQTINPNLINLSMTMPKAVEQVDLEVAFCQPGTTIRLETSKNEQGWNDVTGKENCGEKYSIKGTTNEVCFGSSCPTGKFCYPPGLDITPFCTSAAEICNKQDKNNCGAVDKLLKDQGLVQACARRIDTTSAGWSLLGLPLTIFNLLNSADQCALGVQLQCPEGSYRVLCSESSACSETKGVTKLPKACNREGFWATLDTATINSISQDTLCVDDPNRGAKGVNAICCKTRIKGDYSCEMSNTFSCDVIKLCDDYVDKNQCETNICQVSGDCEWKQVVQPNYLTTMKCVKKTQ